MTGASTRGLGRADQVHCAWTGDGFARTGLVVDTFADDLNVTIRDAGWGEGDVILGARGQAGTFVLALCPDMSLRLGNLLFEAGCRSLFETGMTAPDRLRGTVLLVGMTLWVRFDGLGPGQRVVLSAAGDSERACLRLWPREAVGLGLILIREGFEAATAIALARSGTEAEAA